MTPTADEPLELDADDFPGSPADDPVSDDDLPFAVLFAGVPADEIEAHAAQLREVLEQPEPAKPATRARKR